MCYRPALFLPICSRIYVRAALLLQRRLLLQSGLSPVRGAGPGRLPAAAGATPQPGCLPGTAQRGRCRPAEPSDQRLIPSRRRLRTNRWWCRAQLWPHNCCIDCCPECCIDCCTGCCNSEPGSGDPHPMPSQWAAQQQQQQQGPSRPPQHHRNAAPKLHLRCGGRRRPWWWWCTPGPGLHGAGGGAL